MTSLKSGSNSHPARPGAPRAGLLCVYLSSGGCQDDAHADGVKQEVLFGFVHRFLLDLLVLVFIIIYDNHIILYYQN
jgi:hypothetical protein